MTVAFLSFKNMETYTATVIGILPCSIYFYRNSIMKERLSIFIVLNENSIRTPLQIFLGKTILTM